MFFFVSHLWPLKSPRQLVQVNLSVDWPVWPPICQASQNRVPQRVSSPSLAVNRIHRNLVAPSHRSSPNHQVCQKGISQRRDPVRRKNPRRQVQPRKKSTLNQVHQENQKTNLKVIPLRRVLLAVSLKINQNCRTMYVHFRDKALPKHPNLVLGLFQRPPSPENLSENHPIRRKLQNLQHLPHRHHPRLVQAVVVVVVKLQT